MISSFVLRFFFCVNKSTLGSFYQTLYKFPCCICFGFFVLRPPATAVELQKFVRAQTAVALSRCVFPGENRPPKRRGSFCRKHRYLVNNNHKKPRRSYNGHE